MKRRLIVLLVSLFVFLLGACSSVEEPMIPSPGEENTEEQVTSSPTIAPTDMAATEVQGRTPTLTDDLLPTSTSELTVELVFPLAVSDPYQSGSQILALEQRLQSLGYYETGLVDGVFDEQTALAVRHLQWLNGMNVDGDVSQDLFEIILLQNPSSPKSIPPYPAKPLSQYTTGYMPGGFLSGRLVDLGYLDNADPNFNPFSFSATTDLAVKDFQKKNGFQANGTVDINVWRGLFDPAAVHADGESLFAKPESVDWSTSFYPILEGAIDLAYDGKYIWVLHSNGEDAFDNLLLRIDPGRGLLDQDPPVMLGDFDTPDNRIVEMVYDGNRLWFLLPQSFNPPQIINLIPASAEKFLHATFTDCSDEFCVQADAMGFDGKKIWATANDRAWAIDRNTGKAYLSQVVDWSTRGEMAFDGKCMWMASDYGLATFHTGGNYPCVVSAETYALPGGPVVFDGRRIWVAGWAEMYWLDTKTGFIGEPVVTGSSPSALAMVGETLWVANAGDNTVQGIDVATGSVGLAIPTGARPVALVHDGQRLWVANADDRTLQVVDVQNYQIEIVQPTATPIPSLTPTLLYTLTPTPTEAPPAPELDRTLSLTDPRMRGDDVLYLQNRLLALGYEEVGIPDGVFGPMTEAAVRHFQQRNGITIDGKVGPITWGILLSDLAQRP